MSTEGSPYKYWNEDALSRWLGLENLGWAILDGVRTRVLVDNGARVNSVTPAYVHQHKLGVHPISELDHTLNPFRDRIPLVGLGGGRAEPLGFTLMRVQIEAKPQIPPMEPILCTEPLDLVHIDYVSMEVTVGVTEKPVVKNVLVIEDHFTHFTQAYVTNNHTVRTTARVLYNEFFSVFGFPRRLMSDQASEFTGQVISELCDLLGITKIRTSPYHPQTNGAVE